MIWTLYICFVAALVVAALAAGKRRDAICLAYSAVAILGCQLWRFAALPDSTAWLAFFASWLLVAHMTFKKTDAKSRHVDTSCVMLVGVSLCYAWGWMVSQPFTPSASNHIWAEVFGVSAWLTLGGPSIAVCIRRGIRFMGGTSDRRADILGSVSVKDARK